MNNRHLSPQVPPAGPVDVMSVLHPNRSWVDYRKKRFGGFLSENGISHACLTSRSIDAVKDALKRSPAKVVLNEVWQLTPDVTRQLAEQFPETIFVSMNHGSPSHLGFLPNWPRWHRDFMELARDKENCRYGHVMSDGRFLPLPGSKVIALPNIARIPDSLKPPAEKKLSGKVNILVAGRNCFVKNLHSQIEAAIWLSKMGRHIVLHLLSNCEEEEMSLHLATLKDHGVEAHFHGWADWASYLKWMSHTIDISFCVSLSESYGLIAVESMLMGIPVIGSHATELVPDHLQINPQNPLEIAEAAWEVFSDYQANRYLARKAAVGATRHNEKALLRNIRNLLE